MKQSEPENARTSTELPELKFYDCCSLFHFI